MPHMQALVSSLTTPPEHFSAKIANEFDALFEGIVGTEESRVSPHAVDRSSVASLGPF